MVREMMNDRHAARKTSATTNTMLSLALMANERKSAQSIMAGARMHMRRIIWYAF